LQCRWYRGARPGSGISPHHPVSVTTHGTLLLHTAFDSRRPSLPSGGKRPRMSLPAGPQVSVLCGRFFSRRNRPQRLWRSCNAGAVMRCSHLPHIAGRTRDVHPSLTKRGVDHGNSSNRIHRGRRYGYRRVNPRLRRYHDCRCSELSYSCRPICPSEKAALQGRPCRNPSPASPL
jgi:hypothetical protein